MRRWLLLFLLVPTVAWGAPETTQPRSTGAPHVCVRDYPLQAARERRGGATELAFDITADGTVDALIVAASSGQVDLDLASTRCATTWQYTPATENGTAVKVPWEAMVSWSLDGHGVASAPKIKLPYSNCITANTDAVQRAPSAGVTIVRYKLENGAVSAADVTASSGDPALDAQAASCVKSWGFDTTDSGRPSSGTYRAFIDWHQKLVR